MLSLSQPTGQPERKKKKRKTKKKKEKKQRHTDFRFLFFSFAILTQIIKKNYGIGYGDVWPGADSLQYSRVLSVGSGFFRPLASCGLLVQSTLSKVHGKPPHVGYSKVGASLCAL